MLWGLYEFRTRQLAHEFDMRLEARVSERTRIARELHDTLLQSFNGLLLRFQTVSNLMAPGDAKEKLDTAIDQAAQAITEGRDAVQGLRASMVETNDLALAIRTIGEELAADATNREFRRSSACRWKGHRETSVRSCETKSIESRARRCAMHSSTLRRGRSKWKSTMTSGSFGCASGMTARESTPTFSSGDGRAGHFGLHGMRERAQTRGRQVDGLERD